MRSKAVVAFMAGLCVVAAGVKAAEKDEHKEHENAKKALSQAKITLAEAVHVALKKVPNGKAVEAELEMENDKAQFDVEVIAGGKHIEVEIDAASGNVNEVKDEKAGDEGDEKADDEKTEEAAASAPIALSQAIDAALQRVAGAKAFEAKAEMEKGKLIFEVEVVADGKVMEVEVDAASGKVLEVEEEKE